MFSGKAVGQVVIGICALSLAVSSATLAETTKVEKKEATTPAIVTKHLAPQTTCPIQGDPINKKLFVDAKGKRIYVCCEGCLAQVTNDPDAAIKKLESIGQEPETIPSAAAGKVEPKKAAAGDSSMKGMDSKRTKSTASAPSKAAEAGYYTCSMHPEIHRAVPGNCPQCGMNLDFVKEEKTQQK